jgi:hypothetical protein
VVFSSFSVVNERFLKTHNSAKTKERFDLVLFDFVKMRVRNQGPERTGRELEQTLDYYAEV